MPPFHNKERILGDFETLWVVVYDPPVIQNLSLFFLHCEGGIKLRAFLYHKNFIFLFVHKLLQKDWILVHLTVSLPYNNIRLEDQDLLRKGRQFF